MLGFAFIAAPLMVMAGTFIMLIHIGFVAGESTDEYSLGFCRLAFALGAMIVQAALWVLWALKIGGVI